MGDSVVVLMLIVVIFLCLPKGNDKQVERVERKLNAIVNHLKIDLNPGVDPQVVELAYVGKKMEAIGLYRQKTGVGLREAKEFIEQL